MEVYRADAEERVHEKRRCAREKRDFGAPEDLVVEAVGDREGGVQRPVVHKVEVAEVQRLARERRWG